MSADQYRPLLDALCDIAAEAGDAVLSVYRGDFDVTLKNDRSPLTEADRQSHRIITDRLRSVGGGWPVLSEEAAESEHRARFDWQRYWLVDPLDGTKEFVKRNDEFTVNIALIDSHAPVVGVVLAPALGRQYFGGPGVGAWRQDANGAPHAIRVRVPASDPLRVVGSRSHPSGDLAAYLDTLGSYELMPMGSSLKMCLIAEGEADIYPRLGPTSEWDTAAAQAVVDGAGGCIMDLGGQPLRYNRKEHLLNPHFLAVGDCRRDWLASMRSNHGKQPS